MSAKLARESARLPRARISSAVARDSRDRASATSVRVTSPTLKRSLVASSWRFSTRSLLTLSSTTARSRTTLT